MQLTVLKATSVRIDWAAGHGDLDIGLAYRLLKRTQQGAWPRARSRLNGPRALSHVVAEEPRRADAGEIEHEAEAEVDEAVAGVDELVRWIGERLRRAERLQRFVIEEFETRRRLHPDVCGLAVGLQLHAHDRQAVRLAVDRSPGIAAAVDLVRVPVLLD